jgi:hypothetical protein
MVPNRSYCRHTVVTTRLHFYFGFVTQNERFKHSQVMFAELGQRSAEPASRGRPRSILALLALSLSYHLKLKLEVLR